MSFTLLPKSLQNFSSFEISFLEPIMSGKNNEEFVKDIENKIYTEIKKF